MNRAVKECKMCEQKTRIAVLYQGLCPICWLVQDGQEPVTRFWDCKKCGTRMFSGPLWNGGGKQGCCWMMGKT